MPKLTRFKSVARPIIASLKAREQHYIQQAGHHSKLSASMKSEAIKYFRLNNDALAISSGMAAIREMEQAKRYLLIITQINTVLDQINQLWAQHDAVSNSSTTAGELKQLSSVQTQEMKTIHDEDGKEIVGIPDRIQTSNQITEEFVELVQDMDTTINNIEIKPTESMITEPKDILAAIQGWDIGEKDVTDNVSQKLDDLYKD
jgi:hypothetical protein